MEQVQIIGLTGLSRTFISPTMLSSVSNGERVQDIVIGTLFQHLSERSVRSHVIQVIEATETFRDMMSGIYDVYLSSVSNKINEIM
jgi:hypothetical protein